MYFPWSIAQDENHDTLDLYVTLDITRTNSMSIRPSYLYPTTRWAIDYISWDIKDCSVISWALVFLIEMVVWFPNLMNCCNVSGDIVIQNDAIQSDTCDPIIQPQYATASVLIDNVRHHDDVINWKYFPRYWPFMQGIHRSPVNSLHKGQWRGALGFSIICVWINGWVNSREAGDLMRHRAHYDVNIM